MKQPRPVPADIINPILAKIATDDIITQTELYCYVKYRIQRQLTGMETVKTEGDDRQPFTVMWFNYDDGESHMLHTVAANSIEAMENVDSQMPVCANCSAFPIHLPTNLKFEPDQ
jgi:hypothetical protein